MTCARQPATMLGTSGKPRISSSSHGCARLSIEIMHGHTRVPRQTDMPCTDITATSAPITWENARPAAEQDAVRAALAHPGLLETTLRRLHGGDGARARASRLTVRYLATGG